MRPDPAPLRSSLRRFDLPRAGQGRAGWTAPGQSNQFALFRRVTVSWTALSDPQWPCDPVSGGKSFPLPVLEKLGTEFATARNQAAQASFDGVVAYARTER
ncbi:hypothetical protein Areg01_82810 [Actinoplanes regularis]|nr:hypothetical protein Areg01_82810 [Actinoplanes regularis]